jgi:phosphate transport system protein
MSSEEPRPASNQRVPETPQELLAGIEARLETTLRQASQGLVAIGEAMTQPTDCDAAAITTDAQALRTISLDANVELLSVVARQGPVAHDPRLVLALTQLSQIVGLIANQFDLINEQLGSIDSAVADRQLTAQTLTRMTVLAAEQLLAAVDAFVERDATGAEAINEQDDAVDRLNRQVFEATLQLDGTSKQRELALRHVLIARSIERIGDNAVDIAEQAAFLVNDELRQFTDASHPHKRP